jgi:CBS domain-containing protein
MRAHQIMTRQVITIAVNAPITDAANTMLDRHISGLPVVDETGKLVGIVSQGDFIRRAEIGTQRKRGRGLKFLVGPGRAASDFVHERGRKVVEIMTPDPCTVTEDATLEDIVELMERNNIKRLPVMREDKLVGIVSRSNLLQAVAGLTRDVPDPTADDDHIRNHIIASLERSTGRHSGSVSLWSMASFISAALSPTNSLGKQRSSRRRMSRVSRRFTTIFAGSNRCRECTLTPKKTTKR